MVLTGWWSSCRERNEKGSILITRKVDGEQKEAQPSLRRFRFTCIFLVALLFDPGAQDPGEPANQRAQQWEIQHVVDCELQRLRGHLLQLCLVRVLHPCNQRRERD